MELANHIKVERCTALKSATKTEALHELLSLLENEIKPPEFDGVAKEIFYREQIMSTGIGQGIGIPHVRYPGIQEPILIVGIHPEGIADYASLDDEPVCLIFLILVGADRHKEYLRLLSLLVSKLKTPGIRQKLHAAAQEENAAQTIAKILKENDS